MAAQANQQQQLLQTEVKQLTLAHHQWVPVLTRMDTIRQHCHSLEQVL
jgi:hypothetical protein